MEPTTRFLAEILLVNRSLKFLLWRGDSRWRCENNPDLELSLKPWRGESELHFQTDLCFSHNGEIPKYKGDAGRQAVPLPGEASSRGGGGRPYPAIPTGRACPGALLNRQPET